MRMYMRKAIAIFLVFATQLTTISFPVTASEQEDSNKSMVEKEETTKDSKNSVEKTDPNWFVFNENTIVGYSNMIDAPMDIVIPDSYMREGVSYEITAIGEGAFAGRQLSSVVLNKNIKSIGDKAFYNNQDLTSFIIPDGVETIGTSAFYNCSKIDKIELPDSIVSIGTYSFYKCSNIKTIQFSKNMGTIPKYAFSETGITTLNIPSTITTIDDDAFSNCKFLEEVTIDKGIKELKSVIFYNCTALKKVSLPDTLRSIGNSAFTNCSSLETLILPPNLETIEDLAFFKTGLKSIIIPDTVKTIGRSAFAETNLSLIQLPKNLEKIEYGMFSNCGKLTKIELPPNLKEVGGFAFFNTGLKTIEFPDTVEIIGDTAFGTSGDLTEAKLGKGIKSIAENAFSRTVMMKIDLSEKDPGEIPGSPWGATQPQVYWNTYEDDSCFYITKDGTVLGFKPYRHDMDSKKENHINSKSHTIIDIPEEINHIKVKRIAPNAFNQNLSALSSVSFSEGLESIGAYAFSVNTIEEIRFPNSLKKIETGAFARCDDLKIAVFGSEIEEVAKDAFSETNRNLELFFYEKEVNSVKGYPWSLDTTVKDSPCFPVYWKSEDTSAFYIDDAGTLFGFKPLAHKTLKGIDDLTQNHTVALIPSDISGIEVKEIADSAFLAVNTLTTLSLPSTIQCIGNSAFKKTKIQEVIIPDSVKTIGQSAFQNTTELKSVQLPKDLKVLPAHAFSYTTNLKSITLPEGLTTIGDLAFLQSGLTSIVLPDSVMEIRVQGFSKSAISSIDLGEGLKKIDKNAFENCSNLEGIIIPNTVETISQSAFSNCTELADVIFEKDSQVTTLGSNVFKGCRKLERIDLPNMISIVSSGLFNNCTSLKEVILPEGIKEIQSQAFNNTSLKNFTIPSTVEKMTDQSLMGYNGDWIHINQPRSASPIQNSQPWGSLLSKNHILYGGEYTTIDESITYSDRFDSVKVHLDIKAQQGGVIKTIELPDGAIKTNIDSETFSFDYDGIKEDGVYEFTATSNTGDYTTEKVVIDRLVKATLTAENFSIYHDEIEQLTVEDIIKFSSAIGKDNLTGKSVPVVVETPLEEIKAALMSEEKCSPATLSVTLQQQGNDDAFQVKTTIQISVKERNREHEVQFVDWNQDVLKTMKVLDGETAIPPKDPVRKGYEFIGWDRPLYPIRSDVVITATYHAKHYEVRYDVDGGVPYIDYKVVQWDEGTMFPEQEVKKENHIFKGWKLEGMDRYITATDTYRALVKEDDTIPSITLVAQWEIQEEHRETITEVIIIGKGIVMSDGVEVTNRSKFMLSKGEQKIFKLKAEEGNLVESVRFDGIDMTKEITQTDLAIVGKDHDTQLIITFKENQKVTETTKEDMIETGDATSIPVLVLALLCSIAILLVLLSKRTRDR